MKQLPDILTSVTFWAAIGTLWSAAGAWFTYVAYAVSSRQQTHEGVMNLIAGLEAELELVSGWASGEEGNQGYLRSKTRKQLIEEHPDWFYPARMIFTFETPVLSSLTGSPYAKSVSTLIPSFMRLNNATRRLLDYRHGLQEFVLGNPTLYMGAMKKLSPHTDPVSLVSSTTPEKIIVTLPSKEAGWTEPETMYINCIFGMNENIHQNLIGGVDSPGNLCLYKSFRAAREELEYFKSKHKRREKLPWWYWFLHALAVLFFFNGLWQVLRWFEVWPLLRHWCR